MTTMRALVLTGPGQADVDEVAVPIAGPGDVVVDVHLVGVCGTDEELYGGHMPYFATGRSRYPLRPGHEWCGVVREVGEGVDAGWVGARVTGDTMLRCGRCERCRSGRGHVCADMIEVGISHGFDGALAERLRVPAASLLRLPDGVDDTAGAMVEPGGNAWRAAAAAHAGPGRRVLVWGAGTIGLLAAAFAAAAGAEVHVIGRRPPGLDLARRLGAHGAWTTETMPDVAFDSIIDATNDPAIPGRAVDLVEPGGRVVLIGIAGSDSLVDTRRLALRDVTAVGLLSGSPGLASAIAAYAAGSVDPRPLVRDIVSLREVPAVLAGASGARGTGTKVLVDPRR